MRILYIDATYIHIIKMSVVALLGYNHYRLLTLVFCQTGILNKSILDHSHCDITI